MSTELLQGSAGVSHGAVMPGTGDTPALPSERPRATAPFLYDLPDDPEYKRLPDDEKSTVLDTAIADVHAQASSEPGYDYVKFGQFADKIRDRTKPGTMTKLATDVGAGLVNMGKDMASIPGSAVPFVMHPVEVTKTAADAMLTNTADWIRTPVDFAERHLGSNAKALHSAKDGVIDEIKTGRLPFDDPVKLLEWLKQKDAEIYPLQVKHQGERIAQKSRMATPESAALVADYIHTRNPAALEELKRGMTATQSQVRLAEHRARTAQSKGAQAFEAVYGKGSAQHLTAGYDPSNFLLAGRAAKAATGTSALMKAAKVGGEMAGYGVAGAIRANPDVSVGEAGEEALKMILMGGLIHGAGYAGRRLKAAVTRRRGDQAPSTTNQEPDFASESTAAPTTVMSGAGAEPTQPVHGVISPHTEGGSSPPAGSEVSASLSQSSTSSKAAKVESGPIADAFRAADELFGEPATTTEPWLSSPEPVRAPYEAHVSGTEHGLTELGSADLSADAAAGLQRQPPPQKPRPPRIYRLPQMPEKPAGHPPDILDWIKENGLKAPPTKKDIATKKARGVDIGGDWDWMKQMPVNFFWRGHIFSKNGLVIDKAAQHAWEDGLIAEPTPDALGAAIHASIAAREANKRGQVQSHDQHMASREAQTVRFEKATAAGPVQVHPGDLNPGDVMHIEGHKVTVEKVEYDDDGYTTGITVKDGTTYGLQHLSPDSVLFVEKVEKKPTGTPPPDPFTLKPQTEADIALERQRKQIAAQQGKTLTGTAGEMGTPDMLDNTAGDTPLFSQPSKGFSKLDAATRTTAGYVSPKLLADAATHGFQLLRSGMRDFSHWSATMLRKFGDWIKEHLADLWTALREHFTYVNGASQRGAIALGSPIDRAKMELAAAKRTLNQKLNARQTKGMIAALEDVVDSRPALTARRAANHVRATFGFQKLSGAALWRYILTGKDDVNARATKDLEAAPFVVEGYQAVHSAKTAAAAATAAATGTTPAPVTVSPAEALAALQTQRGAVAAYVARTGKGRPYLDSIDHALANFTDLDAKSQSARILMRAGRMQEQAHGIQSGEVEHYVTHIYGNLDDIRGRNAPQEMFGGTDPGQTGSKYFTKARTFNTLADAIAAGYEPLSTNIAALAEHRIKAGQKLVERARNRTGLFTTTDPATGTPLALPAEPGAKPPANYQRISAGGEDIFVYDPYHGFFKALYQPSVVRNSTAGRAIIRTVQGVKHGTTVFDMLHLMRVLGRQLFTTGSAQMQRSQALLEYTAAEIRSMVAKGELTPQEAAWITTKRPTVEKLQAAGLNIGRVSDALWADTVGLVRHALQSVPLIRHLDMPLRGLEEFNKLVFDKATRSGMVEVGIAFYERARRRGLTEDQAARASALEVNRLFGNIGRQGVFRSRTMQDLARIALFAPQWMEGTLSSEIQALGQTAGAVLDAVTGKRIRAANTARVMLATAAGLLLANQVINYATTGHGTSENEEGHKMDAWIPGGHYGFWINPLTFLNSFLESFHRYYEDQQPRTVDDKLNSALDALTRIGGNKLSGPMRGVWTALSGRDYRGRPIDSFKGRITEGVMSASPLPIPLSPLLERNPGEFPRLSWQGNEPGAWERQAAASIGIHLLPAQGPADKMYALGRKFRADTGGSVHEPSKYTLLRRAIRNGDGERQREEMRRLIETGKATIDNMDAAMGMDGGEYHIPKFTGSTTGERDLLKSLSPEDRGTYTAALAESRAQATTYWRTRQAMIPMLFQLQLAAKKRAMAARAELIGTVK